MNTFFDLLTVGALTFFAFVSAYALMFLIGLFIAGVVLFMIFFPVDRFANLFTTNS